MHYRIRAVQRAVRFGGSTQAILAAAATLPSLDPSKFGVADYDLYAGVIDFTVAKAAGLGRPIIRVGQGGIGLDPQFKANAAKSKGLFDRRDFYWYLDIHQSANGQARACATALQQFGQLDPNSVLFCDFEDTFSSGAGKTFAHLDAAFLWGFIATMRSLMPSLELGIYTGYDFWQNWGSVDPKYGFAQMKLWIAWPVSPYQSPRPLAPWGLNWYYHQWTFAGDGHKYGASSAGVDLDYQNPALVPVPPPPAPVPTKHDLAIIYSDDKQDVTSFMQALMHPISQVKRLTLDSVSFDLVVPAPVPVPVPTPPPPVSNPGKLYYVATNAEYNNQCPPGKQHLPSKPATFSTVGRGQDLIANLGGMSSAEGKLIYRLAKNNTLIGWSQGGGKVYRTDKLAPGEDGLPWPVTSPVSLNIVGVPRLIVNVLKDFGNGTVLIEAIRKAPSYDWFDPDKYPWLGGMLGMNFIGGKDVAAVGNKSYGFYMPIFDPSTFPGPAGKPGSFDAVGMVILKALLFGVCPPEVQATYLPQPK